MTEIRRAPSRHLTETEIVALSLRDDTTSADAQTHTSSCEACRLRVQALMAFCADVSEALEDTAAEALEPDRLAVQRQRIMRRLERMEEHAGPARVLRFPSTTIHRTGTGHRRRWVAAAALAGLLVGLAAGRLVYLPEPPSERVTVRMPGPAASETQRAARSRTPAEELAEEAFLLEVEAALAASRVAELQAIDAMTPRIVEITASAAR